MLITSWVIVGTAIAILLVLIGLWLFVVIKENKGRDEFLAVVVFSAVIVYFIALAQALNYLLQFYGVKPIII